jgi:hypothetical protein
MAKRKREGQTTLFLLAIMLSVLLFFFWPLCCLSFSFSFGHYVVCPSLFLLAIMLHNGQKKKRRTDNTMAKRKREGQTT